MDPAQRTESVEVGFVRRGYLFEEQSRAILETMAVMKMHNQDRSHILTFRPKVEPNDRPGNDSPFRMAISATQRGIGLTPSPTSPKSPFEGKTGLGWAILRGARKVTPLAGTTFKKMVQRKDPDMTPRRDAVTEDSSDGGVSLKKVVAYTWSIVVVRASVVLMCNRRVSTSVPGTLRSVHSSRVQRFVRRPQKVCGVRCGGRQG